MGNETAQDNEEDEKADSCPLYILGSVFGLQKYSLFDKILRHIRARKHELPVA